MDISSYASSSSKILKFGDRKIVSTFVFGLILPSNLIIIGSPQINFARATIILAFIPSIIRIARDNANNHNKFHAVDFIVIAMFSWMFLSVMLNDGAEVALTKGGISLIELGGGYLFVRAFCCRKTMVEHFMNTVIFGGYFVLIGSIFDILNGSSVINAFAAVLFGAPPTPVQEYRFGLFRAISVFDHAILTGTFFVIASAFVVILNAMGKKSLWPLLPMLFGIAISLSAAPLNAAAIFTVFFIIKMLKLKYKVLISLVFCITAFLMVFYLDGRGLNIDDLIKAVTLETDSSTSRKLIFYYAMAEVQQNPIWGIGFRQWARPGDLPSSVDSTWILTAMQYGIPFAAMLMLATFLSMLAPLNETSRNIEPIASSGLNYLIFALMLIATTVFFWGSIATLFLSVVALRVNISLLSLKEMSRLDLSAESV